MLCRNTRLAKTFCRSFCLAVAVFCGLAVIADRSVFAADETPAVKAAAESVTTDLPPALSLLSSDSVLLLEVHRPNEFIEHPLSEKVLQYLQGSPLWPQVATSEPVQKLKQAAQFLELGLGTTWDEGLEKLAAGGFTLAVGREVDGFTPTAAILTTASDQTARQLMVALETVIKGLETGPRSITAPAYRGVTCYRVDEGHWSIVGPRIFIANRRSLLEAVLDRQLEPARRSAWAIPESLRMVRNGKPPVALITANLAEARKDEKFARGIAIPSDNAFTSFVLGGYLDLLRRGQFVSFGLLADEPQLELVARIDAGRQEMIPGLAAFLADPQSRPAARRLMLKDTIYTASWYRDYAALWASRKEVFVPGVVEELEKEEQRQKKEQLKLSLVDIIQMIGPHFRFVATEPSPCIYKTLPIERYPSAGFALDIRQADEFQKRIWEPAVQFLKSPAVIFVGIIEEVEYGGTKLLHLKLHENQKENSRYLYNFDPAIAYVHGHLVGGSSLVIAQQIIDQLAKETPPASPTTASLPNAPTPNSGAIATAETQPPATAGKVAALRGDETQFADLTVLARVMSYYRDRLERELALREGLSLPEASEEVSRLIGWVSRLGQANIHTELGDRQFEWRFRIGMELPDMPQEGAPVPKMP